MTKDIGICETNSNGEIIRLEKSFYGQGIVFKSWDAYENRPSAPCYVPELSDTVYTAENFLQICKGQKNFADELFAGVDWQHPESLMADWIYNNEWLECPNCGILVDYGDNSNDTICPHCGTKVELDRLLLLPM